LLFHEARPPTATPTPNPPHKGEGSGESFASVKTVTPPAFALVEPLREEVHLPGRAAGIGQHGGEAADDTEQDTGQQLN
jgi:hypothetical protein